MYPSRSRSPASFTEGRSCNSYGRGSSFNYSTDFSLSSLVPRNPSIQRIINSGLSDYSRSTIPDYNSHVSRLTGFRSIPSLSADASPTFRRRDISSSRPLSDRSSVTLRNEDLCYSPKSRNYFDYSSATTSLFSSYTPPIKHIKKPQRTDYTDYLRPVLTAHPMLKSGYVPRSRDEREDNSIPLVRERKLIKFREMSCNISSKVRRKISWDLPEEISSPLINEMKQINSETEVIRSRESSLNRRGSQDVLSCTPGSSPMSGSPRPSISRRSSGDQSIDNIYCIGRQSVGSTISREIVYGSFDLKPDDPRISLHGRAPIPPPRKKSIGSSQKIKKPRKSSVELLLSEEKSSNFSKIAGEIRRNREVESLNVAMEESLHEKQRSSQSEEAPLLPCTNISTINTRLSSTVNDLIVVKEMSNTDNDRSRRRRRRIVPEPEVEPLERKSRCRSRFRSQLPSETSDQSTSLSSNQVSEVANETPYSTCQIHRKSLKYNDGLTPRRRSKCPDAVPESVLTSVGPVQTLEGKQNKTTPTEEKRATDFKKLTKQEALSTVIANPKINARNKIKHEETKLVSDKMQISKLEYSSSLSSKLNKISETPFHIDKNIANSISLTAETKNIVKLSNETKSKSNFENSAISSPSNILNESDTKSSNKLLKFKIPEITALDTCSKDDVERLDKTNFNIVASKIVNEQIEAKPTLYKKEFKSEMKLTDERMNSEIGNKKDINSNKLTLEGKPAIFKESGAKSPNNRSKFDTNGSKASLDIKLKIESKQTAITDSSIDSRIITKVTDTKICAKSKLSTKKSEDICFQNVDSKFALKTENVQNSLSAKLKTETDDAIEVSSAKVETDKVSGCTDSVTENNINTGVKETPKTLYELNVKENSSLKKEISKIKNSDAKNSIANSNLEIDKDFAANKTFESRTKKATAVTNSTSGNNIRPELKETNLSFCEMPKLDAAKFTEVNMKKEFSKTAIRDINIKNSLNIGSKKETDKDSKIAYQKTVTDVAADTNSVIDNNPKAEIKQTSIKKFNEDSGVNNKILLDKNSKIGTKIEVTNSSINNKTQSNATGSDSTVLHKTNVNCKNLSQNDSLLNDIPGVEAKEFNLKIPTDKRTTKLLDINQVKNSMKIDVKKGALKEETEILKKNVSNQESENRTEKSLFSETTPVPKIPEKLVERKELEEIVVVCKLPPPKSEPVNSNPNIPSVVVSIKNSALKPASGTANSDIVKTTSAIIPSKLSFSNSKLESGDTIKKQSNSEEPDVKVIHTVVLKPKVPKERESLESKSILYLQKAEKEVGTHGKLRDIPDVIKSTVRADSKTNKEVIDVIRNVVNEDDQGKSNDILDGRDNFENHKKPNILTNNKIPVSKDSDDRFVIEGSGKVESQVKPCENKRLNKSNGADIKDVQCENITKSKFPVFNESDKKQTIKPDLIQMTTKCTEKINETLLPNIFKDSSPEKSADKKIFKIQQGKDLTEKMISKTKHSTIVNLDEKFKVDPVPSKERMNVISLNTLEENFQKDSAKKSNAMFETKHELPVLKILENAEKGIKTIISKKNKSDDKDSSISFDKNNNSTDTNSLISEDNKMLHSTPLIDPVTLDKIRLKDENNKTLFPQAEEVEKKDVENMKNKTRINNLPINQNEITKGKDMTYAYKKSLTVPVVAALAENSTCKAREHSLSSTQKIKKTESISLSTGNVPIPLQDKPLTKVKNRESKKSKRETTPNSVSTDKEKTNTSEIQKDILMRIHSKNSSNRDNASLRGFLNSNIIPNEWNESCLSPFVADTSSAMKTNAKSLPISDFNINSLTENKLKQEMVDKQVMKKTDNNVEFKELDSRIKVEEKVEPCIDSTVSAQNSKGILESQTSFALDKNIPKILGNNSTVDVDQDKQQSSEIFKLPSVNEGMQPNLSQETKSFINNGTGLVPLEKTLDTNLLTRFGGVSISGITQREKEINNIEHEKPKEVHEKGEKYILKNGNFSSSDKNLLLNSEKFFDSENVNSAKDVQTEEKESSRVAQKAALKERKITNDCQTPKEPKLPSIPPPYGRIGLFLKPKEPPQTILESSSSEDESETSADESTVVNGCSNITTECNVSCHEKCSKLMPNLCGVNQKLLSQVLDIVKKGKSPERDEKGRSRSETSNASIYSNFSNSTTCTTFSTSSIEEYTSPIKPKEKLKQLRFRKYEVGDFVFLKLLGKGSFGKVLLAELKESEMYFAIKCLKKDVVLEDDDVESTMIERRVLALGTQHPYMCKLYCTFQTKSYLFFVMEYLNGGDLMFHIQESRPFKEDRAMFYAAEIVSALKFLHKRGIVYRDIKLDNVMLDEQGHVRLVDFGMCQCRIYMEECMPSNFCGTPSYIAPEIVLGQKYNQSVDWWSFGVLLYEMLSGRSPFHGTDEDELFWSICNEEPHYPRFLSKEAIHILGLLLQKSPSKRLGMPACPAGDIKDHTFFSKINWDKIEKKQVPPPFKPSVSGPSDTSNFDSSFTMESANLSPIENEVLESMDQQQFHGFSYTNPHITG